MKTGSQNDCLPFIKARNSVNYAIKRAKSNQYRNNPEYVMTLNDLMGKKSAITV